MGGVGSGRPSTLRLGCDLWMPEPNSGCWLWLGFGAKKAANAVWERFRGATDGYVCHTCSNPTCVNPDHLYLGGAKTNAQSRVRRGRSADTAKSLDGHRGKAHRHRFFLAK